MRKINCGAWRYVAARALSCKKRSDAREDIEQIDLKVFCLWAPVIRMALGRHWGRYWQISFWRGLLWMNARQSNLVEYPETERFVYGHPFCTDYVTPDSLAERLGKRFAEE